MLAAFAVGGVSGSKNGLAPPLGVGGSGARNGVDAGPNEASTCEASARAELEAAVSMSSGRCVSFSFAFSLSSGRDRGVGLLTSRTSQPLQRHFASPCVQDCSEPMGGFPDTAFRENQECH